MWYGFFYKDFLRLSIKHPPCEFHLCMIPKNYVIKILCVLTKRGLTIRIHSMRLGHEEIILNPINIQFLAVFLAPKQNPEKKGSRTNLLNNFEFKNLCKSFQKLRYLTKHYIKFCNKDTWLKDSKSFWKICAKEVPGK
jgi:hypothetical protein